MCSVIPMMFWDVTNYEKDHEKSADGDCDDVICCK